jgi:hypothetical protein
MAMVLFLRYGSNVSVDEKQVGENRRDRTFNRNSWLETATAMLENWATGKKNDELPKAVRKRCQTDCSSRQSRSQIPEFGAYRLLKVSRTENPA